MQKMFTENALEHNDDPATCTTDGFIPLSNGGQVIHYFLRSVSIYRQFRVTLMQEYVCKVFLAKDSISD